MKKAYLTIFAVSLLFIVGYFLIIKKCNLIDCAPIRTFDIEELSLPVALFPKGTLLSSFNRNSDLGMAIDQAGMSAYQDGVQGFAIYTVYQFGSQKTAIEDFSRLYAFVFEKNIPNPLENDESLTSIALFSDEAVASCGISEFNRKITNDCQFIGRYNEYVIFFLTEIDKKMTQEHFEEIIYYIDIQMNNFLH